MKGIVLTLIMSLCVFSACKKEEKSNANVVVPAYEVLNKMSENNGDYVLDIVIPEYSKSTADATLLAVTEKIAQKETADLIYLFNEKPKADKKAKEYVRDESKVIGVFENGKFIKK
jgi:hypothetical protein